MKTPIHTVVEIFENRVSCMKNFEHETDALECFADAIRDDGTEPTARMIIDRFFKDGTDYTIQVITSNSDGIEYRKLSPRCD